MKANAVVIALVVSLTMSVLTGVLQAQETEESKGQVFRPVLISSLFLVTGIVIFIQAFRGDEGKPKSGEAEAVNVWRDAGSFDRSPSAAPHGTNMTP